MPMRQRGRPRSPTERAGEAVSEIRTFQRAHGLTDEALARRCAVSQSSVTRNLNAHQPAWTKTLERISEYAKTQQGETDGERIARVRIVETVLSLWDGTSDGAERLIHALNALAALMPSRTRSWQRRS